MDRFFRFEARRRAAFVALAIESYRVVHAGELPESLEALKSEVPETILVDPFDDEPLKFQRLAKGFVVYSVGVNEIDDSGKENHGKDSSEGSDETFFVER